VACHIRFMTKIQFEGYLLEYGRSDPNSPEGIRVVCYLAVMRSADEALAAVGAKVGKPTDVRLVNHGPEQLKQARTLGLQDGEVREL
jgi:hypothetical protein